MMFKEIQTPFMKHCVRKIGKTFYLMYVLRKFCELIELDEFLVYFPLLKGRKSFNNRTVYGKRYVENFNGSIFQVFNEVAWFQPQLYEACIYLVKQT